MELEAGGTACSSGQLGMTWGTQQAKKWEKWDLFPQVHILFLFKRMWFKLTLLLLPIAENFQED